VILHQLDYQFRGIDIISYIFWLLTLVMLLSMLAIYILRYAVFPHMVTRSLGRDISETACLASISISFTSIIQMMVLALVQDGWGRGWVVAAYALW
jgi:tellurite resistance protein TehA-like permease